MRGSNAAGILGCSNLAADCSNRVVRSARNSLPNYGDDMDHIHLRPVRWLPSWRSWREPRRTTWPSCYFLPQVHFDDITDSRYVNNLNVILFCCFGSHG